MRKINEKAVIVLTATALSSVEPLDRGCAAEHTDSLLSVTWAVLLPGDQRAERRPERDVLLIHWLAQPETALMGAVISPRCPGWPWELKDLCGVQTHVISFVASAHSLHYVSCFVSENQ